MQAQPDKPLRLALYARVSTDEQREGQTIDSQIAELKRFAENHGHAIAGTYKDDGWSGKMLARPALDRLRDDASKGLFDAALVNDVDRLARDVTHLGIVRRDLERVGVRVIFRKLPGENSPTQNLLINVLGSFAEFERELIADRTRRGRRHKIEVRKLFLGAPAPYGYRYLRRDPVGGREGILQVEPAEAAVVRKVFAWMDQEGLSARQVVTRLNEQGIIARKGRPWQRSSVLKILKNETYTGTWHYAKNESCLPKKPKSPATYQRSPKSSHKRRPREDWVALELPEELRLVQLDRWQRVQSQLQRNLAFSPRNSKHFYFLSGLVRCGACAAPFVGEPNHGKYAYRCSARCHRVPMIRENVLDRVVWNSVEEAILNPDLIAAHIPRLEEERGKEVKQAERDSEGAERAVAESKAEEERFLEAYRLGAITPVQLGHELDGIRRRRLVVEEERQRSVAATPVDEREVKRTVADYCWIAARRLESFDQEERRNFLRILVTQIVFEGSRVRIRGAIPGPTEHEPERLNLQPQGATAERYSWGRNSPNDSGSSDAKGLLHFELLRPVPHPLVSIESAA